MSGEKEIKIKINIIKLVLAIQLSVLGLISLEKLGIHVPLVHEGVIFIYITVMPGLLILNILRVKTTQAKFLLMSVGVSLSIVMFLLASINVFLLTIKFREIFTKFTLLVSLGLLITILLIIHLRTSSNKNSEFLYLSMNLPVSNTIILLLFIPLAIIMTSFLSNNFKDSLPLALVLAIISLIPFIALTKLKENVYPIVIYMTSLSLMLYKMLYALCLIPPLMYENTIALIVKRVGFWDPTFPHNPSAPLDFTHNSLLPQVILHPSISILSGVDLAHSILITNTFLFSLTPLALYYTYTNFFDKKFSLLSTMLFVFYPFFYGSYILETRTGFALFFMVLGLLAFFSHEINPISRSFLTLIFLTTIAVSHYGLTYLFIVILASMFLITKLLNMWASIRIKPSFPIATLLYFIVVSFAWHMYTTSSLNLQWGTHFGKLMIDHINEFFSPKASYLRAAAISRSSISIEVTKYLTFFTIALALMGIVETIRISKKEKVFNSFDILGISNFVTIVLASLPGSIADVRVFSVFLAFSAPIVVRGFFTCCKNLKIKVAAHRYILFSLFLIVLLSFGSGIASVSINRLVGRVIDYPPSPHIERWAIENSDNLEAKRYLYWALPEEHTTAAANYLMKFQTGEKVYMDSARLILPEGDIRGVEDYLFGEYHYGGVRISQIFENKSAFLRRPLSNLLNNIDDVDGYILLRFHNVKHNLFITEKGALKASEYISFFEKYNKVYNNGGSVVYYAK